MIRLLLPRAPVIFVVIAADNVTVTVPTGQATVWNAVQNSAVRGAGSGVFVTTKFTNVNYHFHYFLEDVATADSTQPYLYAVRGNSDGDLGVYATKVDLSNGSFGTIGAQSHTITAPLTIKNHPGQPAKYQGLWYFPSGNDQTHRELTVIGSGAVSTDTLTAAAASFAPGADHLANLNHQLVSAVKDGTNSGGVRILAVDGAPRTAANWGSVFQAGDKSVRPAGLRSLAGLTFVMNTEGLYSFNNKGRSGLVFEDFREWQNSLTNIPVSAYSGGLLIPHPSGLLFYVPGEEPVDVGLNRRLEASAIPPSGATEIHSGRYHSTTVVGKFTYAIYQLDPSSTSSLLVVGYPSNPSNPLDLIWQALGVVTVQARGYMMGVGVALNGRPLSSDYVTPTVWLHSGEDLSYMVLDPRASPFRSRTDTHKVTLAADADMSELRFTEPVDLTGVVVHTSRDMVSGDEFQISIIVNGAASSSNVGSPVRGSGTRHERTIDRTTKVTSLALHVNWTATSTADRVPPAIQSIELYGNPSVGE
ncbi:hypothetical protein LCGC14_1981670, partial [marine sediment metagenome]